MWNPMRKGAFSGKNWMGAKGAGRWGAGERGGKTQVVE